MKTRLALVTLSLALSVLIGLALRKGGAGGPAQAPTRPLIGFAMDTLKEARWQRDRDAFVAAANALGADVLVQSANSDDTRQMQDVQALLSAGVKALVVVPHNGEAMRRAVALAHAADVPLLAYDRLIPDPDLDLYVSFDPIRIGEVQAQYLVDRLQREAGEHAERPARALRIVRILGASTDQNAHFMKEGQDRVLGPMVTRGTLTIVHEDWAENWKPEQAKKITNAAIARFGHDFHAVLAANDGTAGGAIQALLEEGLAGRVLVTGQDAELVACQRIVAGTQAMTIYKPIAALARAAAELAVKLARGRAIVVKQSLDVGARQSLDIGARAVPAVLLDVTVVDRKNLEAAVIDSGFHRRGDVFSVRP